MHTSFLKYIHKILLIHVQVVLHTHKLPYIHTSCLTYTHAVAVCFYLYTACNCFCHRHFLFLRTLCVQDIICCPNCGHCGCIPAPPNIHRRTAEKQGVGVVKWRAEMLQGREIRSLWVGIQFEYTFGKRRATNSP